MEDLGALVLLPTLLVFALAIITHRPIESLVIGSLVGLGMAHGTDFITGFADTSLRVMMDETVAWVILVCGFMGSLIALLIRTGATGAFTTRMTERVRSKQSLCGRFDRSTDQRDHSIVDMDYLLRRFARGQRYRCRG
jgi:Na+/H+ antiporter NhaC